MSTASSPWSPAAAAEPGAADVRQAARPVHLHPQQRSIADGRGSAAPLRRRSFRRRSAPARRHAVRPEAITVMAEVGIDISGQESKTLERYLSERWDYVITVCDDANESCPVFPGTADRSHWSFPDPSKATGTQAERLEVTARSATRSRSASGRSSLPPRRRPCPRDSGPRYRPSRGRRRLRRCS